MDNKLVHVLRCVREPEPSNAITAALRRAKGNIKQGSIAGRQDRKVVGHSGQFRLLSLFSGRSCGRKATLKLMTGDVTWR